MWGQAHVSGHGHERYFLLVVDNYTRYTTVFPLRSKGEVPDVLISWIRADRLQLCERLCQDLPVLRLHSDKGVMQVARTSMIHAAAPHFLWPFAVWYDAHQLNLWPRVSLPETSPTLRWTGTIGDASVFRVRGSRAFVRDTSADKLSARAIPCDFLGFPPDALGWQFYHPTSRHVLPSQDVTFDESLSFYRLFPYRSALLPPPPLFLAPGPPPIDPLPPQGPAPSGVSHVDPLPGTIPVEVAVDSGASRGASSGGVASGGAAFGSAEPVHAETCGTEPASAEPDGAESEGAGSGGAEPGGCWVQIHIAQHPADCLYEYACANAFGCEWNPSPLNFSMVKFFSTSLISEPWFVRAPLGAETPESWLPLRSWAEDSPAPAKVLSKKPLELVHMDLVGPLPVQGHKGERYFLTIVDDWSRLMWAYPLKQKDHAASTIKEDWLPFVEKQAECVVKRIRTDRGGEFLGVEMTAWLKKQGIQRELTTAYTPQSNGVAERANRTILETARALLICGNLTPHIRHQSRETYGTKNSVRQ
ncbi:unnamed protein product [Closterium sp. NIES-54]